MDGLQRGDGWIKMFKTVEKKKTANLLFLWATPRLQVEVQNQAVEPHALPWLQQRLAPLHASPTTPCWGISQVFHL